MTPREILEDLGKFPTAEHITIIEAALHLIHEDLEQTEQPLTKTEKKQKLAAAAAAALLPTYTAGGELTVFTVIDNEEFHA